MSLFFIKTVDVPSCQLNHFGSLPLLYWRPHPPNVKNKNPVSRSSIQDQYSTCASTCCFKFEFLPQVWYLNMLSCFSAMYFKNIFLIYFSSIILFLQWEGFLLYLTQSIRFPEVSYKCLIHTNVSTYIFKGLSSIIFKLEFLSTFLVLK